LRVLCSTAFWWFVTLARDRNGKQNREVDPGKYLVAKAYMGYRYTKKQ
jgi:hypothetical protein